MHKKQISVENGPKAIGPYSTAIQAGSMIYISGQLPITADGVLVEDDISKQTVRVIENVEMVLQSMDLSLKNVIKTTVFLSDFNDFNKMNQIYAIYFSHPYPARSCVEVSRLPKDARIEIECIAMAHFEVEEADEASENENCDGEYCD